MDITWKCPEDVFGTSKFLAIYGKWFVFKWNKYFLSFKNRLIVVKSSKHLTAKVQHYSGHTVLESSTDEWSLSKQLYRPYDMSAYINFGRVSHIVFR